MSAVPLLPLALLGLATGSGIVGAQRAADGVTPEVAIERWTSADGLPQNTVTSIVQTRDGYLWFGTFGGLVRFDGLRFTVFDLASAPRLPSLRITALLEDRRGDLWIGTQEGSVVRCSEGAFRTFGRADGLRGGEVWELFQDSRGELWVGANGITRWNGVGFEVYDPVSTTYALVEDGDGDLWAAQWGGLARVRAGSVVEVLERATTWFVGTRPDGSPWIAHGDRVERIGAGDVPGQRVPTIHVTAHVEWPAGREVVGSLSGLRLLREGPDGALLMAPFPGAQDVGPIRDLCVDEAGSLWCGTEGKGLVRLREAYATLHPVALQGVPLVAAHPDARTIWVAGTRDRRVSLLPNAGTERFPSKARGLLSASDGTLWLVTASGLHARHPERPERSWEHPPGVQGFPGSAPLVEDASGAIWYGARTKLVELRDGALRVHDAASGFEERGPVRSLALTPDGSLWVGSEGLLQRRQGGAWTSWTPDDGLPFGALRWLEASEDGTLWIASYGGGLARFSEDAFRVFTRADGLPDAALSCVLDDGHGHLWVNSNRGVFRIARTALEDHAGPGALLPHRLIGTPESGGAGGVLLADGRAFFPTLEGILELDTRRAVARAAAHPAVLEGVRVGERRVDVTVGPVDVSPHERRLSFRFTSPDLDAQDHLRFRYRLAGLQKEWVPAGARRTATYEAVPPGDYRFEVAVADAEGRWQAESAAVSLRVKPLLRETLWFRAGLVVLALAVTVGVASWRVRVAQGRHRRLQKETEERARAQSELQQVASRLLHAGEEERRVLARELHDGLGQELASLAFDATLAERRIASDPLGAREELAQVVQRLKAVARQTSELSHGLHPSILTELGLVHAIEAQCHAFERRTRVPVSFRDGVDEGGLGPEQSVALYRILQEGLHNVERHADATSVRLSLRHEGNDFVLELQDDGSGFDPRNAEGGVALGLASMRERAGLLGGELELVSRPRAGTTVRVRIPARSS